MLPVIARNLIESITLLGRRSRACSPQRCVAGLTANEEVCRAYADSSPAMVTAAEPDHRLRRGGRDRQAGPRRKQDDPRGRPRTRPHCASARRGSCIESKEQILTSPSIDDVAPGDLLLVRPGEIVPVDGRVERDVAVLDESALTGESLPIERRSGDGVRSGAVNAGDSFMMRATRRAADSTYAGIVRLVAEADAEASSAPFVRLADRYAVAFLAVTLAVAGLAWTLSGDAVRAVAVLVVATPCPLILAAPIAITSGLTRMASRGVVVKGGVALERLAAGRVLLLDKTGTLTVGRPVVTDIIPVAGRTADEVLRLAASLDQVSPHVVAAAIVGAAHRRDLVLSIPSDVQEVSGSGVRGMVGDQHGRGREGGMGRAGGRSEVGDVDSSPR